eukprot:1497464-Pyramimonas_sp.AAC.1
MPDVIQAQANDRPPRAMLPERAPSILWPEIRHPMSYLRSWRHSVAPVESPKQSDLGGEGALPLPVDVVLR